MILEFLAASAISSAVAPALAPIPEPAQSASASKSIDTLWEQLGLAIDADDWEAAIPLAKAISEHSELETLPAGRREYLTRLLGLLYVETGQYASALPHLIAATEANGSAELWFARINAHVRTGDRTAAVRATEALLRRRPSVSSDLSSDFLIQMVGDPSVDPEARFALRLALRDAGWRSEHDSGVWMGLIDDLLERNRAPEAVALAPRITSSGGLIRIHAMRRYDDLRAGADLAELDLEALLAAELERDRQAAEAPGASFESRQGYASGLMMRGRLEEALAVVDAALARPAPAPGSPEDGMVTWVMDTRARLLMELGRRDEAIVQMEIAAKRDEGAGDNVSQTINLGWFYLRAGENTRAIATVKSLTRENASPYGLMQAMHVQACAGLASGDARVADPAFAYMEQNWRDAPLTWVEGQACRGDSDGAANTMLAMLADKELAAQAVSALHDYTVDHQATDYDRQVSAVLAVAYARADVVAARDRIARGLTIPTMSGQF